MTMVLWDEPAELPGRLVYRTDLWDPSTASHMANQYKQLLDTFLDAPNRRISRSSRTRQRG